MSKKRLWALAFISALLMSMSVVAQNMNLTDANFILPYSYSPTASFQSPIVNKTYSVDELPLTFTVEIVEGGTVEGYYFLDGHVLGRIAGLPPILFQRQ